MVFEGYLRTFVLSRPKIASLIGDRFKSVLPQGVQLPAVKYQRIDTPRRSRSRTSPGLVVPRFQFDVYGVSPEQARTVADTIIAELDGYRMNVDAEGRSVGFQNMLVANDRMSQDPTGAWRVQLDFQITL
jgi:hypothetical protein